MFQQGYVNALCDLGLLEASTDKTAGIKEIVRGAKGLLRRGRTALPSAARAEAAAAEMGSGRRIMEQGRMWQVPEAPPRIVENPVSFSTPVTPMPAPRHPSSFFGGHKAPAPPSPVFESAAASRAPVGEMANKPGLLQRLLGSGNGNSGWMRKALVPAGLLGGGAYLMTQGGAPAPAMPQQYYGNDLLSYGQMSGLY